MTPDQHDPTTAPEPGPAAPARSEWGDDPPPLTPEEIEDILANSVDGSAAIAALIAELEGESP